METVKLSADGEILIPKAILKNISFAPGTEFILSAVASGLLLTPKIAGQRTPLPATRREELRGYLGRTGQCIETDAVIEQAIKAKLRTDDDATKE